MADLSIQIKSSMASLKGIGPKKFQLYKKMGIETIEDLIYSLPRDYEDRRTVKTISSLIDGEESLVCAKVVRKVKGIYTNKNRRTFRVLAEDDSGSLEVIFFNAVYIDPSFELGKKYYFYGKTAIHNGRIQMIHPDFSKADDQSMNSILPIYSLTEGMTQNERRKMAQEGLRFADQIDECFPDETILRNRLCGIDYALNNIHFPEDFQKLKVAKYRLIFEELLLLQSGLSMIKNKLLHDKKGIKFRKSIKIDDFINGLPFTPTEAQRNVISEIIEDMDSHKIMNRLVQGDVGSGKTVVAAAAIYKAVKNGYQTVMMAPTEILARQHFETLSFFFEKYGFNIAFLSGSVSNKDKIQIQSDLKEGKIQVLIGTHAVIQANISFKKLGLVITDEQHRFGVNQRSILAEKGTNPDVLVMTATPIPRTLALILYGDLDISIIDQMPPGRKEIKTISVDKSEMAYQIVLDEIKKGRQAYIVAPLIEDSESIEAKSATSLFEELQEHFSGFNSALLHGNMKQNEKDSIMEAFKTGRVDVLISTVVIEVGINVPNATVMLIENSERFGLAQLHQLRGRVGRGEYQSYCILINHSKTTNAKERAEIMEKTNDGFIIAEKDLSLRGPGEFFGTRQHGVPELRIANLFKHIKILKQVQNEVEIILKEDPFLRQNRNEKLRKKIEEMFKNDEKMSL